MSRSGGERGLRFLPPARLTATVVAAMLAAGVARAEEGRVIHVEGTPPSSSGGGVVPQGPMDDISPAERADIQRRLRASMRELDERGRLQRGGTIPPPLFSWPLAPAPHLSAFGYSALSNFVDHNEAFPNLIRDYDCGNRTYDTAGGYNHKGTDFFLWPFPWKKMDDDDVYAVAAAEGIIVLKDDGNQDRSCSFNGSPWNAVYVSHADGSVAWYGHLKRGSLTPTSVGGAVARGERLGVVGSSGNSTGPHLHLEVYDARDDLVDPYAGPCNALNDDSWWEEQPSYYDSAINDLSTGLEPPLVPPCPGAETSNASDTLVRGEKAYFTSYFRDLRSGQTSVHAVLRPNGTTYSTWMYDSEVAHSAASYVFFTFSDFAASGPNGGWRYDVTYEGRTYSREFTLKSAGDPTPTSTHTRTPTSPATATPTPSRVATATPSTTRTRTGTPSTSATATVPAGPTVTPDPLCFGDCDGGGTVSVEEIIALVGGESACTGGSTPSADALRQAITNALRGCG